jgi:U3 small nucleolar RNA-associated protein 16
MVTATRNRRIVPVEKESSPEINGSGVGNGKRKAESATSVKTNGQSTKRRKRASEDEQANEDENTNGTSEATVTPAEKPKHFRFGSEEPAAVVDEPVEEAQDTQQNDAEESDDDEATEAIDNSAQLLRVKEQVQKQERARQK